MVRLTTLSADLSATHAALGNVLTGLFRERAAAGLSDQDYCTADSVLDAVCMAREALSAAQAAAAAAAPLSWTKAE